MKDLLGKISIELHKKRHEYYITNEKYIIKSKNKLFPHSKQIIAGCLIGMIIAVGSIHSYNDRNTVYAVNFNDKFLGYVKNMKTATDAIESVKDQLKQIDPSIEINDELKLERKLVGKEQLINSDYIRNIIQSDLIKKNTNFAVLLNDSEIAMVKDPEDANKIIDSLKKYYQDQEKKDGVEVLSLDLKDKFILQEKVADSSKLSDVQAVIDTLIKGKGTTKKYEVKPGDTIWQIARDNDMKIQDIAAVNPDTNMDKLKLGQLINLAISEPYLNVESVVKAEIDESIPYDTKYISDNSIYKGQSKVVDDGQYGINRIVKEIKKLNGKEIANTVVSSVLIKSPITRVLAKGTKDLMGSGTFLWPTSGHVTSGFGYRGGEFHKGLDIASPMGTPIYASDSGTVSFAGWSSGYGKFIIIDHGNGYQTCYGHCSSLYVSAGQSVNRGERIASVGMTGQTTGPHVHFEVRVNGSSCNPLTYLR